jgi:hypothetical protein
MLLGGVENESIFLTPPPDFVASVKSSVTSVCCLAQRYVFVYLIEKNREEGHLALVRGRDRGILPSGKPRARLEQPWLTPVFFCWPAD